MDYSEYLQNKYLFEGSPFIIAISDESKRRVSQNIMQNNSWVQDAIAMELMTIEGNPLTQGESFSHIIGGFLDRGIKITPQDYAQIGRGFGLGQFAINIAIRANLFGENETKLYLQRGDPSDIDTKFCVGNITTLHRLFAIDKTCADIFDFIQNNSPINNEFFRLGIEFGKLYFGIFFTYIALIMQGAFGKERTNQIIGFGFR